MSEEYLIRNGAPTLAGLKTANLFTCPYQDKAEVVAAVSRWNRELLPKGLRVLPLHFWEKRVLLYLYRPKMLSEDLSREEARQILHPLGYDCSQNAKCIVRLTEKLRTQAEFPHEIGLFLGYPPADVRGFMKNSRACKCVGCWKVYGDEEAAKRKFAQYKTCTQVYCRQWAKGMGMNRLAVAD